MYQEPASQPTSDIPSKPVFVSYSTEDNTIATRLVDHLEAQGMGCWLAPRAIPGGAPFPEEIVEGIESR